MNSTPEAADSPAPDGTGLLERIGDQLAALTERVADIDSRMTSVEAGDSGGPIEVQLSPETVAQIADALAALQAAGTQALDDAFKSGTDELTEALSTLVTSEISRVLADAGYEVAVAEVPAESPAQSPAELLSSPEIGLPEAGLPKLDETPPETAHAAAPAHSTVVPEALPAMVAPLATTSVQASDHADGGHTDGAHPEVGYAEVGHDADGLGAEKPSELDEPDTTATEASTDGPPLRLEDLDDPFLEALIRKEPLSA